MHRRNKKKNKKRLFLLLSFSVPFFAESNSTPNHYIRIIFIAITRTQGHTALTQERTRRVYFSSSLYRGCVCESRVLTLIFSLLNEVELRRYARTRHSFCLTRKINHLPSPAPPFGLNEKADFARACCWIMGCTARLQIRC